MDEQTPTQSQPEPIAEPRPNKLKKFIKETIRVLRITRKPDQEEYKNLIKVTSIGAAVIGLIGFILFLIKQILFKQ